MTSKNNIKKFIKYFSGMKYRVPVYEDGTAGKPELLGRFTTVKNEEDMAEYEVTKKDDSEQSQESQEQHISTEFEEETYL